MPHEDYNNCEACDIRYFNSLVPSADVFPVKDGEMLLVKRKYYPQIGFWDVLGGYMKNDETAEEAMKREAKEETNLEIEVKDYLGSYVQEFGEFKRTNLIIRFVGEITGGEMKAQEDADVLRWFPIDKPPKKLAFKNVVDGIADLQKWMANKGDK